MDKIFNDNREITSNDLKLLWNEAVKATLSEVKKYDGLIPNEQDRINLTKSVADKIMYKIKPNG